jgi:hypothetical protein
MDCGHGPVRHTVRLAFSRNSTMTKTTDIAAEMIISPSSPAPAARHRAASGLDRSAQRSKIADRADDASLPKFQTANAPSRNFFHKI